MTPGWIQSPNSTEPGWHWITRRAADAAEGYGCGDLPDIRECRQWNGRDAWFGGYEYNHGQRRPYFVMMHTNNGWRYEGAASQDDVADLAA